MNKYVRNLFLIVSDIFSPSMFQANVSQHNINVSEICLLTVFWHIFTDNVSCKCFIEWPELSQKSVRSNDFDSFLTLFWIVFWQFSDRITISDNILTEIQIVSDIFLTEKCKWQIYDKYLTDIWHFSDIYWQMTVFWQISDRYLTDLWNFGDQHWLWVPKSPSKPMATMLQTFIGKSFH